MMVCMAGLIVVMMVDATDAMMWMVEIKVQVRTAPRGGYPAYLIQLQCWQPGHAKDRVEHHQNQTGFFLSS